jgi:predicted porin
MWSVGINYQVTPAADISLAYTTMTGDTAPTSTGTGVTAPTTGTDTSVAGQANSVNMWGLTGRYNLSKRTQFYAGAGVANNSGAYFMSPIYGGTSMGTISTPTQNGVASGSPIVNGNGASITAYMVGLKHTF